MSSTDISELGRPKLGEIGLAKLSVMMYLGEAREVGHTCTSNLMTGSLRPVLSKAVTLACSLY